MNDPIHDPKADLTATRVLGPNMVSPYADQRKPPSSYLPDITRAQLIDRLLTALLGALAAILVPWLVPYTRPPATVMVPEQQAKIESGAAAAVIVTAVFGE